MHLAALQRLSHKGAFLATTLNVVLFLLPLSAHLCAQTTPADTGFIDVEARLSGRSFDQLLPFDVPFLMHGSVPDGTKLVQVCDWEFKKKPLPQSGCVAIPAENDCVAPPTTVDVTAKHGPFTWQRVEGIDVAVPPATQLTFRVMVQEPLQPNRYYVFTFLIKRQITPAQAATFAKQAFDLIDRRIRVVLEGSVTLEQSEEIRHDLMVALMDGGCGKSVEAHGTFLDSLHPNPAELDRFHEFLQEVLDSQRKAQVSVSDYSDGIPMVASKLLDVSREQRLRKLRDELTSRSSALKQAFVAPFGDSLLLLNDSRVQAEKRGRGVNTLSAETTTQLKDIFDPTGVTPYIDGYEKTRDDLEHLDLWLLKTLNTHGQPLEKDLNDAVASVGISDPLAVYTAAHKSVQQALSLVVRQRNVVDSVHQALERRSEVIDTVAAKAKQSADVAVILAGSTTGSFQTAQLWYVSADTGFIYAGSLHKAFPYAGANIYFRPINKDAPLKWSQPWLDLPRRAAMTIAVTLESVSDNRTRDDLFQSSTSVLLGGGIRITRSLRIGAGALLFLKRDVNPLINHSTFAATPYFSFSFDLNIAKMLGAVFTRIGG